MGEMSKIIDFFKNIDVDHIRYFVISVVIFWLFKMFNGILSSMTIRILKPKINKKQIKNSSLYIPLKIFYVIFGLYLGIRYWNINFPLGEKYIYIVNKCFRIALIIIASMAVSNSLTVNNKFLNKLREKSNHSVGDASFRFIVNIIKMLIYIVAGFLVITELGYNLNGLVAGLGLGSIVITLAAQDTAKNIFGGLIVLLDNPFNVGDWVQVKEYEGIIENITFRSTRIRNFENAVVNIPNSVIASESIINLSRMEKRRYRVNLCLELSTPLEKIKIVKKRIVEMLKEHDDIIGDMIIVNFETIADNGINLLVYAYTNSTDYAGFLNEKDKINFKIMQILREEDVNLAYDTKTIYVKK